MRKVYKNRGFIWCVYDKIEGVLCTTPIDCLHAYPTKRLADDVVRRWNKINIGHYKTVKVYIDTKDIERGVAR